MSFDLRFFSIWRSFLVGQNLMSIVGVFRHFIARHNQSEKSLRSSLGYFKAMVVSHAFLAMGSSSYVFVTLFTELKAPVFMIASVEVILMSSVVFALPASLLLRRLEPKWITICVTVIGRSFLIPILSLLLLGPENWVWLIFILFAFHKIIESVNMGPIQVWVQFLVPHRIKGRYMGGRIALGYFLITFTTILTGWWLDREGWRVGEKYAMLMSIALLATCVENWLRLKIRRSCPSMSKGERHGTRSNAGLHKEFFKVKLWRVATSHYLSILGYCIITPFILIILYQMGMSKLEVGIVSAVIGLGMAAGCRIGGRLADRTKHFMGYLYGNALHIPVMVLFLTINSLHRSIDARLLFTGVCVVAFLYSLANGLALIANSKDKYKSIPDGDMVSFVTVNFINGAMLTFTSVLATALGSWLMAFSHPVFQWGTVSFGGAQTLILLSATLSVVSLIALIVIHRKAMITNKLVVIPTPNLT